MIHKYNKMIQEIIRSKMIKFLDISYIYNLKQYSPKIYLSKQYSQIVLIDNPIVYF